MGVLKIIMTKSDWEIISDLARKEGYMIPHEINSKGCVVLTTDNVTSYLQMASAGVNFIPASKKRDMKAKMRPYLRILKAKEWTG